MRTNMTERSWRNARTLKAMLAVNSLGSMAMGITRSAVEAGAEALYRETVSNDSPKVPFHERSLQSKERYRGIVRAALIADMDSRSIDDVAEAIYICMDTKNAAERPFELRPEGSKERYRDLARAILQAAK